MATNTKFPNYNYSQFNKHGIINPQFHNWTKPNQIVIVPSSSGAETKAQEESSVEMQTVYPDEEVFQGSKPNTAEVGTFDVYKYFKKP